MIRLALMGDLHYPYLENGDPLWSAREVFYSGFFHEFLATDADYYVSVGDLSHYGRRDEFEQILPYIGSKQSDFHFVLGNHDVIGQPKETLLSHLGHPRYYSIETEEAVLVFLDTTKELKLHGWGLDMDQWYWLENQLQRYSEKRMVVIAHHPVPDTTSNSPKGDRSFEPYQDLRPLLIQRRAGGLFLNGHTHTHSIFSSEGWHYVQTSAVLCEPSFRLIEVGKEQLKIKRVQIKSNSTLEAAQILHDHLEDFHRPESPPGCFQEWATRQAMNRVLLLY